MFTKDMTFVCSEPMIALLAKCLLLHISYDVHVPLFKFIILTEVSRTRKFKPMFWRFHIRFCDLLPLVSENVVKSKINQRTKKNIEGIIVVQLRKRKESVYAFFLTGTKCMRTPFLSPQFKFNN